MKTKREIAHDILIQCLAAGPRVLIDSAVAQGAACDVSKRTLQRAARDLRLVPVHNGPRPAFWERAEAA